jgi:hypothetical protein
MTKKSFFRIIFAILILGLWSCTKKGSPDTPFTHIQGFWKLAKTATDDNGNGIIDAGEIHSVAATYTDKLYFKSDSTGYEQITVNGDPTAPLHYRWKIAYGDSLYMAYAAHDTPTYYISLLNSVNMTLSTITPVDSGSILTQYYYNKD